MSNSVKDSMFLDKRAYDICSFLSSCKRKEDILANEPYIRLALQEIYNHGARNSVQGYKTGKMDGWMDCWIYVLQNYRLEKV